MPRFDINEYETVEERIKRFTELHPDGRIVTELVSVDDVHPRTWVFKATVYLSDGDQAADLPKATGYASEIDGTGGANNGSACENAETSAIGRSLANMSLSGRKRPSQTEMAKVIALETRDWVAEADKITNVEELRNFYAKAKASGATPDVLEKVKQHAETIGAGSENSRTGTGVSGSNVARAKKRG